MADLEGRINLVGSNQPGSHMQAFSSSDAPPAPNLPLPPPGAPVRAYENTLNEPISETIMRDLRMIGYKLKYVLNPKMREERAQKLRDWDLWGPLILCLFLAMILSFQDKTQPESIFGTIFVIIWAGAFIVTMNAKLLGGSTSFFQSVCVLGYCVFPLDLAALTLWFLPRDTPFLIRLAIVGLGFAWSTMSSVAFMGALVTDEKKVLGVYPVFLFYLFLAWFVLIV
eukprot:TRINITY_DN2426_c0_g1_i1.p1 TRINITY_DN2426_c0_g1~~TRINITY_DN2426_c0_g1_i1.p1  ORF type:complete len:226 (+),score=49.08 TRINITY_DN2426_c0_g1_i1:154-831(+)